MYNSVGSVSGSSGDFPSLPKVKNVIGNTINNISFDGFHTSEIDLDNLNPDDFVNPADKQEVSAKTNMLKEYNNYRNKCKQRGESPKSYAEFYKEKTGKELKEAPKPKESPRPQAADPAPVAKEPKPIN